MELQLHGSNRVVYKAQLHGRVFQTLGQHIRSLLQCLPFLSILLLYLPSFPVWLSCSGCRSNDKVFIIVSKWIPREDLVAWTSPALTMTVIDRDWGGSSLPYFCWICGLIQQQLLRDKFRGVEMPWEMARDMHIYQVFNFFYCPFTYIFLW